MKEMDSQDKHLDNLRQWRVRKPKDVSTKFLGNYFKREIQKPFKQLQGITQAWVELIPADLQANSQLDKLSRGTLTVIVNSSATLYELDRQLRSGLQKQLSQACRPTNLNRVKLIIGQVKYTPRQ